MRAMKEKLEEKLEEKLKETGEATKGDEAVSPSASTEGRGNGANWKRVERMARLFRAGFYPHVGREFTIDDVETLTRSPQPVPVLVEHGESPLKLGVAHSFSRVGEELWGILSFTDAAWALLVESGARWLSVGINTGDMHLSEVSIVRNPAVPGAMIFSVDENEDTGPAALFSSDRSDRTEADSMSNEAVAATSSAEESFFSSIGKGVLSVLPFLSRGREQEADSDAARAAEEVAKMKAGIEAAYDRACAARAELLRLKFATVPPAILEKAAPLLEAVESGQAKFSVNGRDGRELILEVLEAIADVGKTLFSEAAPAADDRPSYTPDEIKIFEAFGLKPEEVKGD